MPYKIAWLREKDDAKDLEKSLGILGFTPDIYSPAYEAVTKEMVMECHQRNLQIIPWTVNDPDVAKKLKAFGVDGYITDYPDRIK